MTTKRVKTKILFVEFLEHGGSSTALVNFIEYLNKNHSGKFECIVATSKYSIFKDFKKSHGFKLYEFNSQAGGLDLMLEKPAKTILKYFQVLWFLFKIILKEKPKLIHTFHYMWSIYTNPLGYLTNTQVLIYLCDVWMLKPKISRILMKFNPRTRYIAVSKYVNKMFTEVFKVDKKKVVFIYDGINPDGFPAQSPDEIKRKSVKKVKQIIYISRITPERDLEKFIETAAIAVKENKNLKFKHLGYHPQHTDVDYFKTLKMMVAEMNLKNNFEFITYFRNPRNVAKLIRQSYLMIIPARQFALPNIAIQAMMSGVPVIANNVGGNPEIIKSGKNGILLNVNSPVIYAEQILKLINSPSLYFDYSLKAISYSRNTFNAEVNYAKVIDVYTSLGF
jgi:glycosyltransferase involved in cell wall biosynthesis